jgi:hypothetical protein
MVKITEILRNQKVMWNTLLPNGIKTNKDANY